MPKGSTESIDFLGGPDGRARDATPMFALHRVGDPRAAWPSAYQTQPWLQTCAGLAVSVLRKPVISAVSSSWSRSSSRTARLSSGISAEHGGDVRRWVRDWPQPGRDDEGRRYRLAHVLVLEVRHPFGDYRSEVVDLVKAFGLERLHGADQDVSLEDSGHLADQVAEQWAFGDGPGDCSSHRIGRCPARSEPHG